MSEGVLILDKAYHLSKHGVLSKHTDARIIGVYLQTRSTYILQLRVEQLRMNTCVPSFNMELDMFRDIDADYAGTRGVGSTCDLAKSFLHTLIHELTLSRSLSKQGQMLVLMYEEWNTPVNPLRTYLGLPLALAYVTLPAIVSISNVAPVPFLYLNRMCKTEVCIRRIFARLSMDLAQVWR
jgi:hypothetical protein